MSASREIPNSRRNILLSSSWRDYDDDDELHCYYLEQFNTATARVTNSKKIL
jgi:thymidylate synthase